MSTQYSSIKKSIMAVGAHADDHELNVGGTLAKYHDLGYEIIYVMSTNNMSGDWAKMQPDGSIQSTKPPWHVIRPQRILEAEAGARALGTKPVWLDHPQRHYAREDGSVCEVRYGSDRPDCVPLETPTILTACHHEPSIRRVVELIEEHNPEAILTHGMPMVNPEHFGTCVLVTEAYRRAVRDGYDGMLLLWKDLGVWTFGEAYSQWDTHVDITEYWQKKLELSALHACQKPDPTKLDWPAWGAACGCGQAEVFTIAGRSRCPEDHREFTMEILHNAA